ncbi:unnamed protein product [Caenorhabditis auriculariae]|uniref:Uncharacterized protein n=1 Tax=Caenorhabditis auriculariae TaxID=2777116 RepID=A0A8S1HDV8_9PELO|nr:unnamed protein product [Caenorhabditis auriculariae]
MLRHWRSDPVLIKPSYTEFIRKWNSNDLFETGFCTADLYGIVITLSEVNYLTKEESTPFEERDKRQRKLSHQMKRRNSVILANIREEEFQTASSKRWNSSEEIRRGRLESTNSKRVSFSVNAPSVQKFSAPPSLHQLDLDLPRPILRKPSINGKETLCHMDFDTFVAWRRGSKLSDDVMRSRKEALFGKDQPSKSSCGDCWLFSAVKSVFESCLKKPRINPSDNDKKDTDVISIAKF